MERFHELENRVERLERRLRFSRAALVSMPFALALACAGLRTGPSQPRNGQVLRVRGLIVEDSEGRERILLGAPVPKVPGRKRQDEATGLLVLGENGADRVAVGAPNPDPQMMGKVAKRISPGAGIQINDSEGNERGGFGALDDGRVVLGLDYPGREAVSLFVLPEGFAGLTIAGEEGSGYERAGLVVNNKVDCVRFKLADASNRERALLDVEKDGPAKFLVYDPNDKSYRDVLEKIRP